MGCITWIFWVAGSVMLLVSVIRWFEQTTEAVDNGWWNKLAILLLMQFAVWFFPSRVSAGRGFPVPLHEPVRGFGKLPKSGLNDVAERASGAPSSSDASPLSDVPRPSDVPPPGTPAEFIGMPVIPLAKKVGRPTPDPDKIAKLKQKMREQGMLPPDAG